MRPSIRPLLGAAFAVLCLAGPSRAGHLDEFDASFTAAPRSATASALVKAAADPTIARIARVQTTDERYDVPAFVWGERRVVYTPGTATRFRPTATADAAARSFLGTLASLYRLQRADVTGAKLVRVDDSGSGAILATYRQEVGGIEVFRDEFRVCLDRNLELVAVAGSLPSRAAAPADVEAAFAMPSSRAVALALADYGVLDVPPAVGPAVATTEGGYELFEAPAEARRFGFGLAVEREPRARKVWFRIGDALEPAWYVEVMGETAAYSYVFSAADERLLFRHSIMQDAAFSYRVWANAASPFTPTDGPQGDAPSPHPTGLPDFYMPTLTAPSLVSLQNSPYSNNDPWLAPGATVTTGNNVDAYDDIASPDGFTAGDVRPTTTSAGVFDRVYDVNQGPGASTNQRMAAATSLFYLNNWLHDWFYDSGFDEASGNGQTDNYGRGGVGGDPILAEGQDYGGTNNANMSTPADGGSPRMQMYVFNPPIGAGITVSAPAAIAGNYLAGVATGFGPQTFTVSGQVVAATDAVAPTTDGCTAITNNVSGKIALIDRGTCGFSVKVLSAQTAGAIGVIIVDNVSSSTPPALGGSGAGVLIPSVSVTLAVGNAIRAQLGAGVTVTLNRPTQVQRDGTIDGTIVSHEWAHHVSNRLVGNASGLSNQQGGGMGEGWSDFFSLLMTVRPGDNLAGCYGVGAYALSGNLVPHNYYYFGIRRYPYSTDFAKNPLTFKHITDGVAMTAGPPINGDPTGATNSEVHRTGEVWCNMLWECYAGLLADTPRLTFAQAQSRMKSYVIGGLKLTPNAPTLVEARDAILAIAYANDVADFQLLAQAFARRGLGSGAVAPSRGSTNNAGVIESFVVGGNLTIASATLTDDLNSCDADSYLDNGERGTLRVSFRNTGATTLTGTTVSVSSPNLHVLFPSGNLFNVASNAPFTDLSQDIPVALDGASPGELLELYVAVDDPGLVTPGPRLLVLRDYVHADEAPAATDLAESHHSTWTASGSGGDPWARVEVASGSHAYHVDDAGGVADLRWTSPPLNVSPSVPLVITFQHRWSFEYDAGADYDGGVVEISTDGGTTWTDVGASCVPGYTGTLYNASGNPIGGRSAWTKASAGYPTPINATLSLGTTYAGQTVRLRFRHAADAGVGAPGWWIDNIATSGVTNVPFLGIVAETEQCLALGVDDALPTQVALAITGSNPARGGAQFRFALPQAQRVRLSVLDLAGRVVATLADGEYSAGWHGASFTRTANGTMPAAGVYFARMTVGDRQYTQRIVVLR